MFKVVSVKLLLRVVITVKLTNINSIIIFLTYYQRNREVMLNRTNKYYENNKEVLRERAKKKYRELSNEEKNIKREYERNKYPLSEEDKQRLKECQKNYREAKKHLS